MKDQSLQTPRKEIDKLDDEIVRLLNERAQYVIKIGKLKKASDTQANLHTPAREAEIMERLCKVNPGPFPNDALRAVYREIMSGSLALEGPVKVAYLGPRATFTHLACIRKFGSSANTSRRLQSRMYSTRWSEAGPTSVSCRSRIQLKGL